MTLADLSILPPVPARPVESLESDLLEVITSAILSRPRSAQVRLGPSEIGCPCSRRLAYKLAGTPVVNAGGAAWRPQVGVAVHDWLAGIFAARNATDGLPRYLVEFKVEAGQIGDDVLAGHCDLYDRASATVVDWKVVGPASLKKYRQARHPGEQYRVQAHTYGKGWLGRGMTPAHVAIVFLPSAGELSDAYTWVEPFSEAVADAAIARASSIARLVAAGVAPGALPTADAFCAYCPMYVPAVTDLTEACPGHRADIK